MKIESIGKLCALVAVMGMTSVLSVRAEDEETPLAEQMEEVSKALKGLRKAEGFEAKAELARKAQAASIKTLEFLPAMFEGMDEKTKVRATADYKRLIGLTLAGLAELELAFLAEDEAKADAILDKLKDLKGEGHDAYIDEE